jgi:hypothetical protein
MFPIHLSIQQLSVIVYHQNFETAQIIITDKNRTLLKQSNISGSANGTVQIDASTLSSGTYNYSLVVDGRIITSKQMIVGK